MFSRVYNLRSHRSNSIILLCDLIQIFSEVIYLNSLKIQLFWKKVVEDYISFLCLLLLLWVLDFRCIDNNWISGTILRLTSLITLRSFLLIFLLFAQNWSRPTAARCCSRSRAFFILKPFFKHFLFLLCQTDVYWCRIDSFGIFTSFSSYILRLSSLMIFWNI